MKEDDIGRLVSPDEMLEEAKKRMLAGREPASKRDWSLIINFFAANIARTCESACCRLLKRLYNIPLTDEEIEQIVQFQITRKEKK